MNSSIIVVPLLPLMDAPLITILYETPRLLLIGL
jgi:hypothetical protein